MKKIPFRIQVIGLLKRRSKERQKIARAQALISAGEPASSQVAR